MLLCAQVFRSVPNARCHLRSSKRIVSICQKRSPRGWVEKVKAIGPEMEPDLRFKVELKLGGCAARQAVLAGGDNHQVFISHRLAHVYPPGRPALMRFARNLDVLGANTERDRTIRKTI